ncbi:MAG: hypothetical protein ABI967_03195 [bacterium]
MKRLLIAIVLSFTLSGVAFAGDIPSGGSPQPSPGDIPSGGLIQRTSDDIAISIILVAFGFFGR